MVSQVHTSLQNASIISFARHLRRVVLDTRCSWERGMMSGLPRVTVLVRMWWVVVGVMVIVMVWRCEESRERLRWRCVSLIVHG